jgi:hypothetical protein
MDKFHLSPWNIVCHRLISFVTDGDEHPKQKSVAATSTTVGANENFRVKIADPKILGRESTSTY